MRSLVRINHDHDASNSPSPPREDQPARRPAVGTSEFRTRAHLFTATPRARHDELAPRSQARPASRQTVREPARRTPRTLRPESNAAYQVSFRRLASAPYGLTLGASGLAAGRLFCLVSFACQLTGKLPVRRLSVTDPPTAIPKLPVGICQSWVAVSQSDIGR